MKRAAIVGATGYAGRELVALCKGHGAFSEVVAMSARPNAPVQALDPRGETEVVPLDLERLGGEFDAVFSCLPHGVGASVVRGVLDGDGGAKVVDLSADHRFADPAAYEAAYGAPHPDHGLCDAARYGLTEHDRADLAGARLVANPGCYPTATLLALLPLIHEGLVAPGSRVVVDAKSGVSGAGKGPSDVTLYGNVNETLRAYGVGHHRHAPEIASRIDGDVSLSFVPHLVPMFRGMLSTVYVEPSEGVTATLAADLLAKRYASEPFVHVLESQAQTGDVAGTNHCHLSVANVGGAIVVTSAIDNLVKGAAGQALQNMNVLLGLPETQGLA